MKYIFYIACLSQTACVGPSTPFGAINDLFPGSQEKLLDASDPQGSVKISFLPQRQVLHDKHDFILEVKDLKKIPDQKDIRLFYNSRDVTDQFFKFSEIEKSLKEQKIKFRFDKLRLRADRDNDIQVFYGGTDGKYVSTFKTPTCDMLEHRDVGFVKGFRPPNEYISWARDISMRTQLNPSFLTAIMAQESGFNPKAVSPAKALGLTQITPLAEEQIQASTKNWPRRDISSLSYIELKSQILTGELNSETDWRLSPMYSIQGGAEYIQYLREYWTQSDNLVLLKKLPGDEKINLSKIILASYNSGPSRVKGILQNRGSAWLEDDSLKEARKYVKLVFSYCYHFSERSVQDDG